MKRTRHTPEQLIYKLREADALVASGATNAEVCRSLGVSEATYHRWKAKYRGAGADEVRRLKELEKENRRLKEIVADLELDKQILKEALRGNY